MRDSSGPGSSGAARPTAPGLRSCLAIGVLAAVLFTSSPVAAQPPAETPSEEEASAYGGSVFKAEWRGVSAGFHRWLGRVGTHYVDCVGATMLVALDDPWLGNQIFVGPVFATAVGQYGDPDAATLFAAAASTTDYVDEGRSVGGTTALPPLPFSYSTLAARAGYRLKTDIFLSGGAYLELGYGLVGTTDEAQMSGYATLGGNVIIKLFPTLIMTLGLQARRDLPMGERIAGFEEMSSLAVYNSFEVVKF